MPNQELELAAAMAVHEAWQSTSPDLSKAIHESEILLTYAAQHGIVPAEKTLQILLRSKRLERTNNWSVDDETRFWLAFDELVELVHPVTPETLEASLPPTELPEIRKIRLEARARWSQGWRKFLKPLGFGNFPQPISQARESVQRYTKYAFFSLVSLLIVQIYWVVGSHVVLDVNTLFQQRGEVSDSINRLLTAKGIDADHIALAEMQDSELKALRDKYKFYDQKLDASYELLQHWNTVWQFILHQPTYEGKVSPYNNFAFKMDQGFMVTQLEVLRKKLNQTDDIPSPDEKISSATKAASGVAQTLQDDDLSRHDAEMVAGLARIETMPSAPSAPLPRIAETENDATLVTVDDSKPEVTPTTREKTVASKETPNKDLDVTPAPRQAHSTTAGKEKLVVAQSTSNLSAEEINSIEKKIKDLSREIYENKLQHEYNKARNRFFLNITSASFTLEALQIYFLPLLYGLLGACTYVLRQLSMEVKQLTYSRVSEIRYGLRLALGALGGMAISWFIKPDEASGLASLGPLALAFLTGYNVELLFAIMDKIINSALNSLKSDEERTQEKQTHLIQQTNATPLGTVKNQIASFDNVNEPPPSLPPSVVAKADKAAEVVAQAASDATAAPKPETPKPENGAT